MTLNLMHGESNAGDYWNKFITPPTNHEVTLKEDPGIGKLSEAEKQILIDIFNEFGCKSRWELRDFTHSLGEWENPEGSSIRIDYREILRASNKTEAEIEAIINDLENIALLDQMFD